MANRALGQRAIVVGAGMGGLAAAALAGFFSNDVVVDRDELPHAERGGARPRATRNDRRAPARFEAMLQYGAAPDRGGETAGA